MWKEPIFQSIILLLRILFILYSSSRKLCKTINQSRPDKEWGANAVVLGPAQRVVPQSPPTCAPVPLPLASAFSERSNWGLRGDSKLDWENNRICSCVFENSYSEWVPHPVWESSLVILQWAGLSEFLSSLGLQWEPGLLLLSQMYLIDFR